MGEGLGGWGARHPTCQINSRNPTAFHPGSKFFSLRVAAASAPAGAGAGLGPRRQIGRQIDLATVRKFEISQADAAPAAFDHITGADREPARKTTGLATHASLLRTLQLRQLCMTEVPIA